MANMQNDEEDGALDQRALLDQLRGGNTGVFGNPAEVASTRGQGAPALDAGASAAGSYAPVPDANPMKPEQKQTYALEGYDAGKLASDHDSAKYQIGRTLQNYDPRQGITPDVLAALNGMGIGSFSGSKDKLRVTGGTNGLQGDTDLDVVRGFNDPNSKGSWQYGVDADNVTRAGAGGKTAQPSVATSVGLPQQPTATNTSSVPTDAAFFNALLERMRNGAGDDVMNQSALLQQLG